MQSVHKPQSLLCDGDDQVYYKDKCTGNWFAVENEFTHLINPKAIRFLNQRSHIACIHTGINHAAKIPTCETYIIRRNGSTVNVLRDDGQFQTRPDAVTKTNPIMAFAQAEELYVELQDKQLFRYHRGEWLKANFIMWKSTPPALPYACLPILKHCMHSFRGSFTECYLNMPYYSNNPTNPRQIVCYKYDYDISSYVWQKAIPHNFKFVDTAGGYFVSDQGQLVCGDSGAIVATNIWI